MSKGTYRNKSIGKTSVIRMRAFLKDNKLFFVLYAIISVAIIWMGQSMGIPFHHSMMMLLALVLIFPNNVRYFSFLFIFSILSLGHILLFSDREWLISSLLTLTVSGLFLAGYHVIWRYIKERSTDETLYSDSVLSQINDGVVIWELDGRIIEWNKRLTSITGIKKSDAINQNIMEIIQENLTKDYQTPDFLETLVSITRSLGQSLLDRSSSDQFLLKIAHPVKGPIYLQARVFLLDSEEDHQLGAIVRDVTRERSIAKQLEKNEHRLNAILEDQTDMICRYDLNWNLTYVNEAFCKHAGGSREDLIGTPFLNLVGEKEREGVIKKVQSISKDNPTLDYNLKVELLGEEVTWENWTDRGIFNEEGELIEYQAVGRDITSEKMIENLLLESSEMLNTLTANAPGLIFLLDSNGEFLLSAGSGLSALGYRAGELVGQTINDVFSAQPQNLKVIQSALDGHLDRSEMSFNGSIFDISFSPFHNSSGERTGLIGIGTDTTDQLRAQQDLKANQQVLRGIFKAVPAPFMVWQHMDGEFYLSDFNNEAARMTDYKAKDFIGVPLSQYYADLPEMVEDVHICYKEQRQSEREMNYLMRTTGKVMDAVLRLNFVPPDLVMVMQMDITEQKTVERNLQNRIDELTALRATLTDISSHLDLDELLTSILERAVTLLGSASGELALFDEGHDQLRIVASYNMGRDYTGTIIPPGEGVMGRVLEAGKPVAVDNYANWEGRMPEYSEIPWNAGIGIPLRQDGRMIGVIGVVTQEEDKVFSTSDARLLMLFAQQAAIAIENANLFHAAEERASEAETLAKASAAVASTLNQEEAIRRILEQLLKVVSYDSASIQLVEGNELVIVGGGGYIDLSEVIGLRFNLTDLDPGHHILETKEFLIVDDVHNCEFHFQGGMNPEIRSWMGVPMILRERVIGILTLDNTIEGFYKKEEADLVSAFADQVAIAIENARLYQEAQQLAITDPLTNVYNRRFMEESLARELLRLDRTSRPLGVVMLDIDYFKVFNDNYGHTAGDQLLIEMAKYIKSSIRGGDVLCRYGGEEFLMILPELNLIDTIKRAEDIRKGIMDLTINYQGQELPPITASFGVANFNSPDVTVDDVLRVVDTALYKAKESGRNVVKVADL